MTEYEDKLEIEKFSKSINSDKRVFNMLKKMNDLRLSYIKKHTEIAGKKILDIGCGIGLLSEELCKLKANVTGIDPSFSVIEYAKMQSKSDVKYINITILDFIKEGEKFDLVFAMEVAEHVKDPKSFFALCASLVKEGGKIFFSTINKTFASYIFAIIGAEYVLKLLPKKTHCWGKFIKPSEIYHFLQNHLIQVQNLSGVRYNPFTKKFSFCKNLHVNYMGYAIKSDQRNDCYLS